MKQCAREEGHNNIRCITVHNMTSTVIFNFNHSVVLKENVGYTYSIIIIFLNTTNRREKCKNIEIRPESVLFKGFVIAPKWFADSTKQKY